MTTPKPALQPVFDDADRRLALELFESVRKLSASRHGVTRPAYSDVESAAMGVIVGAARDAGLEPRFDAAANLVIELPSASSEKGYWVGSHLDSVPEGGNYDGLAGVIAALLCMIKAKHLGIGLPRPLTMLGLRGEESAFFGKTYLGSYALFGLLHAEDLARLQRGSGRTLGECLLSLGADADRIGRGEPLVDPASIGAWLELHIEQGPIMHERGVPVGVVTGIRGNIRYQDAHCRGVAGHSGAVPREYRHDAVLAFAELMTRLEARWAEALSGGADLVFTSGIVGTDPEEHSASRIPGDVHFSIDIRSQSTATLEDFHQQMLDEMASIERSRGVRFELGERVPTEPGIIDADLASHLRSICDGLQYPYIDIPSGAGHDAAVFAKNGVPAAMIFVRNDGGSHNPAEAMEIDDFMLGCEVLYRALTT